jgi:hypothetical protein
LDSDITLYITDSRNRRGRKTPTSPKRSKTPTKQRELTPPKKTQKDDFFDSKSAGPTFTFRSYDQEGQTAEEEYLSGYKVITNTGPKVKILCHIIHT